MMNFWKTKRFRTSLLNFTRNDRKPALKAGFFIKREMVAVSCRKALEQYIQATNTHEFENVKKLLHPDAVYWFSDETCSGVKEIQRYFENAWKQIENEVYSASHISWITETDEQAVCLYTYEWKGFLGVNRFKGQAVRQTYL